MKYFVPSKTFLTGEYSVLIGGAGLGLATTPFFEISYAQQMIPQIFHHESPAGRYLQKKQKKLNIQFYDPYKVRGVQGGYGRSTAEYFAVALPDILAQKKTAVEIKEEYLSFFEKQAVTPSGMDLLIQYIGGVAYVNSADNEYRDLPWKFPELDFFLISTGLKIKTHEHLENLDLRVIEDLPQYSNQVIDAYLNKTSDKFLQSLKTWTDCLKEKELTHPRALDLKKLIEKIPDVKLVKPCGALGADVMIVFFDHDHKEQVHSGLKQQKISIQAGREDLAEGLVKYVG